MPTTPASDRTAVAPLGEALTLPRGPAWRNRFVLAPLTNGQSHADGTLSDAELRWLTMRAEGGFGLTMTCAAHVHANGQGFAGQLAIHDDRHLPGLTRLAETLRARGSASAVQLYHGGMRADPALCGERVAPSDDAKTGARAMTTAEVEAMRDAFIAAGRRAERAGFDGVELHGAHGYLLAQFISPQYNRRDDAYGGTLENRARLLHEIIGGLRRQCGPDFQIGVRLSPERFGMRLAEVRELAAGLLRDALIDYLDLSLWDVFKMPHEDAHADRSLLAHFTDLPRGDVRLGAAGKLMSAHDAVAALDAGCDFVVIGRAAILRHDFADRVLADPAYAAPPLPVAPDTLAAEGVSPVFVDYLRTFGGFVADGDTAPAT
ncbi:MAG: NADH:flavin oxidoreductase [Algiphilus sp.]